jgi:hydroxymethylglutaryl-CoA synthase
MTGIESYGIALPALRIVASEYVKAWGLCGARGMKQKTVCAYDEDAVTLGIEAARMAFARLGKQGAGRIDALFFGITTPPYDEKPSAALMADTDIRVTEITGSPQAGVQALVSALEFSAANKGRRALVIAADVPTAPPDAVYEHALGAGAAAFVVGGDGGVAELSGHWAVTRETFGARFRRHGEDVLSDLELRTRDNLAVLQALGKVVTAKKVKHLALGADAGLMRGAARAAGLADAATDALWSEIGDAGAASAPLALAAALDGARSGDAVLVAGLGAGATAALFTTSKGLAPLRRKGVKLADAAAKGRAVDYVNYLKNRHVLSSRTGGRG